MLQNLIPPGDYVMRPEIQNEDSAWVVQIYEEGAVKKKRFESEVEASAWAANFAREVSIKAGSDFNNLTFGDLLDRYAAEESSKRAPANYAAVLRKIKYFKNKWIILTMVSTLTCHHI